MTALDFLDRWTPLDSVMAIGLTLVASWAVVVLRIIGKKIGESIRPEVSSEGKAIAASPCRNATCSETAAADSRC